MKTDVVLCGVGGQGVLSAASILAETGLREGLQVQEGEIHGMSQRGGAVQATLRLSDGPISGTLIPLGTADLLLALEPLEALRYTDYLAPDAWIIAAEEPFENIPNYPEMEEVRRRLSLWPRLQLVPAAATARRCGNAHASNAVLLGAAAHLLPVSPDTIVGVLCDGFREKGERAVRANVDAFRAGQACVASV